MRRILGWASMLVIFLILALNREFITPEQLLCYAKATGYLRFFHPGHAYADWDQILVNGCHQLLVSDSLDEALGPLMTANTHLSSNSNLPVHNKTSPQQVYWQYLGRQTKLSSRFLQYRANTVLQFKEIPHGQIYYYLPSPGELQLEFHSDVIGAGSVQLYVLGQNNEILHQVKLFGSQTINQTVAAHQLYFSIPAPNGIRISKFKLIQDGEELDLEGQVWEERGDFFNLNRQPHQIEYMPRDGFFLQDGTIHFCGSIFPEKPRNTNITKPIGCGLFLNFPLALDWTKLDGSLDPPSKVCDPLAKQCAILIAYWHELQHFSPHLNRVQWEFALKEAFEALLAGQLPFQAIIEALAAKTNDGHALISPSADKSSQPNILWAEIEDKVLVTYSQVSQLPVGSIITHINNNPIEGLIQSATTRIAAATDATRRGLALDSLFYGSYGSSLQLKTEEKSLTLVRDKDRNTVGRKENFQWLNENTIYIDFGQGNYQEFLKQMEQVQKAALIIFDMRNYPSENNAQIMEHFIEQPILTGSHWVPQIVAPDFEGVTMRQRKNYFYPKRPFIDANKVFLINEKTLSQGEWLSKIVKHYKLGLLLGRTTAGSNGTRVTQSFIDGWYGSWTQLLVKNLDGSDFFGIGVRPDFVLELKKTQLPNDPYIQAALEWFKQTKEPIDSH